MRSGHWGQAGWWLAPGWFLLYWCLVPLLPPTPLGMGYSCDGVTRLCLLCPSVPIFGRLKGLCLRNRGEEWLTIHAGLLCAVVRYAKPRAASRVLGSEAAPESCEEARSISNSMLPEKSRPPLKHTRSPGHAPASQSKVQE